LAQAISDQSMPSGWHHTKQAILAGTTDMQGTLMQCQNRRKSPALMSVVFVIAAVICSLRLLSSISSDDAFASGARSRITQQKRLTAVLRHAEGFGSVAGTKVSPKKGIKTVREEDLKALHGDQWEVVDRIFNGQPAQTPAGIMMARFTALIFKDPVFLAATERDGEVPREERAKDWAVTLGIQKPGFLDRIALWGEDDKVGALKTAEKFKVVEENGNEIEFKIFCAGGKVLHERSTFREDKRFGFIYTGESSFINWS